MALAGGVAVCAGFVIVAGGFVPGAGLFVIVGACFVIGGRVAGQGRRQAVFIQRAGVFCEVNQGNFRRRGYELIILAVFVVQIGHAVIPRNIPVLGLGGSMLCCACASVRPSNSRRHRRQTGQQDGKADKRSCFRDSCVAPFRFVFCVGSIIPRNAPAVNRGGAVFLFWGCYPGHNLQAKHPAGGVFGILC